MIFIIMQQIYGMKPKDKKGRFSKCAIRVTKSCLLCRRDFEVKKSLTNKGRGKYCSRQCCDEHKKILYTGKNNPLYGKVESEEHKKSRMQKIWESPNIRKNMKKSMERFREQNGYWPGSDKKSSEKRKKTFMSKYGVPHNWMLKEIRQKCEETCMRLYGKYSWQLMNEALQGRRTQIELKTENILKTHSISFSSQYEVKENNVLRIYDFYIPSIKLFIEVDGDFWHGNPSIFCEQNLLEVQISNQLNDKLKNDIVERMGCKILRFWESDVNRADFEDKLMMEIKSYENVSIEGKTHH